MKKTEWVSGSELARRTGVSRQRIHALFKSGRLKRNRVKQFNFDQALEIINQGRALNRDVSVNGEEFSTLTEARKAVETWRAKNAELDFLKRRGELVEVSEVIEFCQKIIASARAKILAVPSRVAPKLAGIDNPKTIKQELEKELHKALNELARLKRLKNAGTSNK